MDLIVCAEAVDGEGVGDCSFPYTYDGALHHECTVGMAEIDGCGCRGLNFTILYCGDVCPGMTAVWLMSHSDVS